MLYLRPKLVPAYHDARNAIDSVKYEQQIPDIDSKPIVFDETNHASFRPFANRIMSQEISDLDELV